MPFISVAVFVFLLYCVLDVALSKNEDVRNFPKLVWLVLVVLLPVIGGVTWLIAGRPSRSGRAPGGGSTVGRAAPPRGSPGGLHRPQPPTRGSGSRRPRGPDDDPEFLRRLNDELRPDDED